MRYHFGWNKLSCPKLQSNQKIENIEGTFHLYLDNDIMDKLFGLIYFRGILGVNLHMTDRLFSGYSHLVFGVIMSKNRFRFLKGHICFDNARERTQLWETDRFAAVKQTWEIFNSNFSKHVAPFGIFSIDETLYPMR